MHRGAARLPWIGRGGDSTLGRVREPPASTGGERTSKTLEMGSAAAAGVYFVGDWLHELVG